MENFINNDFTSQFDFLFKQSLFFNKISPTIIQVFGNSLPYFPIIMIYICIYLNNRKTLNLLKLMSFAAHIICASCLT